MADIFVSYAQADREWVKELATALEAEGLSVWWDPNLLPGTKFRDAIQSEMDKAKAVVVVWSHMAVESDWVRDEAEDGRQLRKLVPVLKDPVTPPHGFRQLQTANLSQWRGRRESPDFRMLVQGIRALSGGAEPPVPLPEKTGFEAAPVRPEPRPPQPRLLEKTPTSQHESAPGRRQNHKLLMAGAAAALLLIAGGLAFVFHGSTRPAPAANTANQEDDLWDSVRNSNNAALLQTYLDHYPNGVFAGTARAEIAALNKPASAASAPPAAQTNPVPKSALAPAKMAKAVPPPVAAPSTKLNAQVSQAVNAARAAEEQARSAALQARDAQGQAEQAMQQAEQAAQQASLGTAGYGTLSGPTNDGGTFRWLGQVVGRAPGSLGVFSVTSGALSGNRYEGEVRNSQGNGMGVNIRATGLRYEGQQRDSHYGDYGVISFPNGDRYEGQFQESNPVSGIYTGGSSETYREKVGQWVDLKLNGYAVINEKDGSSKEGAFKDDQLSGYGAAFDAKGHVTQQGIFVAGTLTTPLAGN